MAKIFSFPFHQPKFVFGYITLKIWQPFRLAIILHGQNNCVEENANQDSPIKRLSFHHTTDFYREFTVPLQKPLKCTRARKEYPVVNTKISKGYD